VYGLNLAFAIVLSAAGGVWPPIALALAAALGAAIVAGAARPRLAPGAAT
jgi:hypothetical protein